MKKFIIANEISYKLAWQVINSYRNETTQNNLKEISNKQNESTHLNKTEKVDKEKNSTNIDKGNSDKSLNITSPPNKIENIKSKVPENKMININIYNHNINHFIISPKENKKPTNNENNKNIKSFRSSYSNNTSVKSNDNWTANIYSMDKKANKPVSDIANKLMMSSDINTVTTPQNNTQTSTNNSSKISSNIKIIINKSTTGTKTPQNQRPASAYFNKKRILRDKSNDTSSLKDSNIKNTDNSILKRKNSATSFLNPISTNSNINRSDSTSSYTNNTAKSQKSSIIFNKNHVEKMKNGKGNISARVSTSVVKPVNSNISKKPIGIKVSVTKNNIVSNVKRENSRDSINSSTSKRSYSLSSTSRDKKAFSKNSKNLRLMEDPRFFDNKSNVSDNSYTKSNKASSNRYPSLKKGNIQIRVNSVNRNISVTPSSIKGNNNNLNVGVISYGNKKSTKDKSILSK